MPIYNIPKVYTSETDLTNSVTVADGSTYAALCGDFQWGPAELPVLLTSENDLVDIFGKPTDDNFISFFSAANFLTYSPTLRLVRVVDEDSALNASSGNTSVLIKNTSDYEDNVTLTNTGAFVARYPGELGNSLFVACCDSTANLSSNVYSAANSSLGTWSNYFSALPSTSDHAASMGGLKDEIHVLVFDVDGKITGSKGTLLEKYEYLSKAKDAKKEGVTNYYRDVLNNNSKYIRCGDTFVLGANNTATISSSFTPSGNNVFKLLGGANGSSANSSAMISGYEIFDDKKAYQVSHFITANCASEVTKAVINIAERRNDSVVFVSPEFTDLPCGSAGLSQSEVAGNIIDFKNNVIGLSSSYYFVDNNWAYQYDKYNDTFRWIPCNSHVAGISARTDRNGYEWQSLAGYNRGILNRVQKLAWNPKDEYVGRLYSNGINSIVFDESAGSVLIGDKTGLSKSSSFDRINVRKLFNALKIRLEKYFKYVLFETNDEFTRDQVKSRLDSYLLQVKGLNGLYDFEVVCNSTNNNADIIDSNTLVVDVYIKPVKSINFIQLNMVSVGSSVSFNEIVGRS